MTAMRHIQETRKLGFESYGDWQKSALTPEEAAVLLGVDAGTFRRCIAKPREEGAEALFSSVLDPGIAAPTPMEPGSGSEPNLP